MAMNLHPSAIVNALVGLFQHSYSDPYVGLNSDYQNYGVVFQAWSGAMPATPAQAPAGTKLGQSAVIGNGASASAPWMNPANGVMPLLGEVDIPISAAGSVGFIRAVSCTSGDGALNTFGVIDAEVSASASSGYAWVDAITVSAGATLRVNAMAVEMPATLAGSTIRMNAALRNALLNVLRRPNNGGATLSPIMYGDFSSISAYAGSQPADADTAMTGQTLVAKWGTGVSGSNTDPQSDWFTIGGSSATLAASKTSENAVAAVTPTFGVWTGPGGVRMDFSMSGPAGGGDMTLASATVVSGSPITLAGGMFSL